MTPKRKPTLPRAVRELLRFVAKLDGYTIAPVGASLSPIAQKAARILGTTPTAIVAKARKAGL